MSRGADLGGPCVHADAGGRDDAGATAATRAVDIWERLAIPDAPDYATVLALYAELQTRRGDYATAREFYEKAMSIRADVFAVLPIRNMPVLKQASR